MVNKFLQDNESKVVDLIFNFLERKTGVNRKYILYGKYRKFTYNYYTYKQEG